jgi:hypothetical protein
MWGETTLKVTFRVARRRVVRRRIGLAYFASSKESLFTGNVKYVSG